MLTEKQARIAGSMRHYADSSEGDSPLLLLHGVTRRGNCFQPILPAFALSHRLYVLDFRGHGRSEPATSGYRVIDYVNDATSFIQDVIGQPTIVYGHSLGSMVAAATAARIPELVTHAILEDPPFETMGNRIAQTPLLNYFSAVREWAGSKRPLPEIAQRLGEIRMQTPGSPLSVRLSDIRDPAWLRFAAGCVARLDPAVLDPIVEQRWLEDYKWESILKQIACPTLLLQASWDRGGMLTDDDAQRALELLADGTLVRFECHHLIHWFAARDLMHTCLHFLGSD